jgi:hypothetical protein
VLKKAVATTIAAAGVLVLGSLAFAAPSRGSDAVDNVALLCNNDVNAVIAIPVLQGDDTDQGCLTIVDS